MLSNLRDPYHFFLLYLENVGKGAPFLETTTVIRGYDAEFGFSLQLLTTHIILS